MLIRSFANYDGLYCRYSIVEYDGKITWESTAAAHPGCVIRVMPDDPRHPREFIYDGGEACFADREEDIGHAFAKLVGAVYCSSRDEYEARTHEMGALVKQLREKFVEIGNWRGISEYARAIGLSSTHAYEIADRLNLTSYYEDERKRAAEAAAKAEWQQHHDAYIKESAVANDLHTATHDLPLKGEMLNEVKATSLALCDEMAGRGIDRQRIMRAVAKALLAGPLDKAALIESLAAR